MAKTPDRALRIKLRGAAAFFVWKLDEEEFLATPAEMRKSGVFADDISLLAVSEAYGTLIEVSPDNTSIRKANSRRALSSMVQWGEHHEERPRQSL